MLASSDAVQTLLITFVPQLPGKCFFSHLYNIVQEALLTFQKDALGLTHRKRDSSQHDTTYGEFTECVRVCTQACQHIPRSCFRLIWLDWDGSPLIHSKGQGKVVYLQLLKILQSQLAEVPLASSV